MQCYEYEESPPIPNRTQTVELRIHESEMTSRHGFEVSLEFTAVTGQGYHVPTGPDLRMTSDARCPA